MWRSFPLCLCHQVQPAVDEARACCNQYSKKTQVAGTLFQSQKWCSTVLPGWKWKARVILQHALGKSHSLINMRSNCTSWISFFPENSSLWYRVSLYPSPQTLVTLFRSVIKLMQAWSFLISQLSEVYSFQFVDEMSNADAV